METHHDFVAFLIFGSILGYIFSVLSRVAVFAILGYVFRHFQAKVHSISGVRTRPARVSARWAVAVQKKEKKFPIGHIWMMCWGGLRGAVALLLCVKLRHAFKEGEKLGDFWPQTLKIQVIFFTIVTVFLSLLLQAGTYEHFANWLKVTASFISLLQ